ncbi:MAG: hypothetical protein ABN490_04690, partial [Pantoea agglomerans]
MSEKYANSFMLNQFSTLSDSTNTHNIHDKTNGVVRMKMKGRALLAGCVALAMSHAALAEDIKV